MSISKDLWQSNLDFARSFLEHSFIEGIARGTLERACFAFYVAQDTFFLEAFARAYSIAAAKTIDWEDFQIFHQLADGVLAELALHQSYAAKWGVNLLRVVPAPATRRYTDFLLATAWGCDIGSIAVAMIPCLRLYTFLGQKLAEDGIPEHQYSDWIRTYSSREFEILALHLENLADRYVSDTPLVRSTYQYALSCERDFFSAAVDRLDE